MLITLGPTVNLIKCVSGEPYPVYSSYAVGLTGNNKAGEECMMEGRNDGGKKYARKVEGGKEMRNSATAVTDHLAV